MATFFVLPSRHLFGQRLGELFSALFPGARWTAWDWPDLAESLGTLIENQAEAHVVYREDLADELSVKDALMRDFGAALDDEIIEIHFGAGLTQFLHQHWGRELIHRAA